MTEFPVNRPMVLYRVAEDRYRILAPAKINLTLSVFAPRADGYHNLRSVMQAIDFCDRLLFEPGREITLTCDKPDLPTDHGNLVFQAALELQKKTGSPQGISISLEKKIPDGAGLGGGSSDAAAALIGLNRICGLGLSTDELVDIGAKLGADVPFFLKGGTMLAEGIGDRLTPLPTADLWVLLILFDQIKISTAWAYLEGDRLGVFSTPSPAPIIDYGLTKQDNYISILLPELKGGDLPKIAGGLYNDFEAVVFPSYPEIEKTKKILIDIGIPTLLSGSGSTLFSLFETREKAEQTQERLLQLNKKIRKEQLVITKTLPAEWGVDKR